MSVTSELQNAARAIRRDQAPDATMHHAVADLLDQVALTTPPSVIESQAGPITRKALAVAREYRSPGGTPSSRCICAGDVGSNVQCTLHGLRAWAGAR